MAISYSDIVTRVREDIADTTEPYTYSASFLGNKIFQGVRILRDLYPETCEGWYVSEDSGFNVEVSGDINIDNYLQTLSIATQMAISKSQRFEDQNNSVYNQDISGTIDTRDLAKNRKEIIRELESDLSDHMASIHDVYDKPSLGSIGLDTKY